MRLFRVIIPVGDTQEGRQFYAALFGQEGEQVAVNRVYFDGGGVVMAVVGPGERAEEYPLPDDIYFATDDLEGALSRAEAAGATIEHPIESRPWGERSFYLRDPWGNPVCVVDEPTVFTGGRFVD